MASSWFTSAGWRDIIRPVRDRLEKLLPGSEQQGPDEPEEYLCEGKGFTAFKSFGALKAWSPEDADYLQKASIPPHPRPASASKAKLLLIHDYAGGYRPEESIGCFEGVDQENFYIEDELQRVEAFVYFSHRLVTIPPAAWTNTLHRNGVRSLGTLIIERSTRGQEALLAFELSPGEGTTYSMAKKLARIAETYGFDGYLVNIEASFSHDSYSLDHLLAFLAELRARLGENGQVVWYDALTVDNEVAYQNTLTSANYAFFCACGHLLTNYAWDRNLLDVALLKAQTDEEKSRIYFGVDVWAQSYPKSLLRPRTTFPKDNGGGTRTSLAVKESLSKGFGSAIFAPAWTFEHFSLRQGPHVNRSLWEGLDLPSATTCGCWSGKGTCRDHSPPSSGVVAVTPAAPCGSSRFFWTTFSRSYARHPASMKSIYGEKKLHAQLSSQMLLPMSWRTFLNPDSHHLRVEVENSLKVWLPSAILTHKRPTHFNLPLFSVCLEVDSTLIMKISYRDNLTDLNLTAGIYTLIQNSTTNRRMNYPLPPSNGSIQNYAITIDQRQCMKRLGSDGDVQITQIGVYVGSKGMKHDKTGSLVALQLSNLTIMPCKEVVPQVMVKNFRIEERNKREIKHYRLCWELLEKLKDGSPEWMTVSAMNEWLLTSTIYGNKMLDWKREGRLPRSPITGSVSHFIVSIEVSGYPEPACGDVFGTEMVLPEALVEKWKASMLKVHIDALQFGGKVLKFEGVELRGDESTAGWEPSLLCS